MQGLDPALWPLTATVTSSDHLALGGCNVVALARAYGTPLYLLDAACMTGQIDIARR